MEHIDSTTPPEKSTSTLASGPGVDQLDHAIDLDLAGDATQAIAAYDLILGEMRHDKDNLKEVGHAIVADTRYKAMLKACIARANHLRHSTQQPNLPDFQKPRTPASAVFWRDSVAEGRAIGTRLRPRHPSEKPPNVSRLLIKKHASQKTALDTYGEVTLWKRRDPGSKQNLICLDANLSPSSSLQAARARQQESPETSELGDVGEDSVGWTRYTRDTTRVTVNRICRVPTGEMLYRQDSDPARMLEKEWEAKNAKQATERNENDILWTHGFFWNAKGTYSGDTAMRMYRRDKSTASGRSADELAVDELVPGLSDKKHKRSTSPELAELERQASSKESKRTASPSPPAIRVPPGTPCALCQDSNSRFTPAVMSCERCQQVGYCSTQCKETHRLLQATSCQPRKKSKIRISRKMVKCEGCHSPDKPTTWTCHTCYNVSYCSAACKENSAAAHRRVCVPFASFKPRLDEEGGAFSDVKRPRLWRMSTLPVHLRLRYVERG